MASFAVVQLLPNVLVVCRATLSLVKYVNCFAEQTHSAETMKLTKLVVLRHPVFPLLFQKEEIVIIR